VVAEQMVTRYPEFTVTGTPREMGIQLGEQAGVLIRRFCELALDSANRMNSVSVEQAEDVSRASMKYAQSYAPHLMEEFEAIGESAGVPLLELMIAQVRNQFGDETENACTSLSLSSGITQNGTHLLAQTWDADPVLDEVTIVLTRRPHNKPAYISVGQAGLIGYMGVNAAGIGCCLNTLPAPSRGIGVPHYFSLRCMFEQTSLPTAVSVLEDAYRAIPVNIMMTSPDGPANIEATIDRVYVQKNSEYLIHTNHCLHQQLKGINEDFNELCDSYSRLPRMHTLLENHRQEITTKTIARLFSDHDNFPGSICRHQNLQDPKHGFIETVFAMIVEPEHNALYVSRGKPCEAPFEHYTMH